MAAGGIEQGEDDATAAHEATRGLHRALNVATIGSFVNIGIAVISALVISRLYGAAILGEYALALTAAVLLPAITTLGEQIALVRFLAMEPPRGERGSGVVLATLTLSYALTLVISPLVVAGSVMYLNHAARLPEAVAPMAWLVLDYIFVDKLSWNLDGVLSAYRAAGALAIASVLNVAVFTIVAIGLGLADRSVWSLTIAYLASSAVALAFRLWAVRRYLRVRIPWDSYRQGLRELPDIVRFGLRVQPGVLSRVLTSQSALWVLGATASVATVGAFTRAQSITIRIADLNDRLAAVIYPSLVRRAHVDDGGTSLIDDVVTSLGRTFAPLLVAICAAAGASYTILSVFGQDFVSAEAALAILLIATGISTATMIFGEAVTALDRAAVTSWGYVLGLATVLATLVPLARLFGATGAALAFLAGILASSVIMLVALVRAVPGGRTAHRLAIRGLVLTAACAVVYFGVHRVQAVAGPVPTVAVGIVVAGLVLVARRRAR